MSIAKIGIDILLLKIKMYFCKTNIFVLMLKLNKTLFIFLFYPMFCFSQKADFGLNYSYFFDNTEFSGSKYAIPQTMSGMHILPAMTISFDNFYKIVGGANILIHAGASTYIKDVYPVVYFQFKKNNSQFYAGAFPRSKTISYYSDFLFSDSILYYKPTLNGLYWRLGNEKNYLNTWLDWTGKQSAKVRETFYAGISAKWSLNNVFYFDFQSYLFHYAKTRPSQSDQHVCDNAQAIVTCNYANPNFLNNNFLKLSAGIFTGFERERNTGNQSIPNGFVAQILFENKLGGLDSKIYLGDPRMILYQKYGNQLYWGNPFIQSGKYLENKFYIKIFNNERVNAKIGYTLHFAENKIYHEQQLTLNASLENIFPDKKITIL